MSFLHRLFGRRDPRTTAPPEMQHVAFIEFDYGSLDPGPLFELESRLERRLRTTGVGVYVGNQMATDGCRGRLSLYGPDADALLTAIRPTLSRSPFLRGARVLLRYGPDRVGVLEREIVLD